MTDRKRYDPVDDLWHDESRGRVFVRNEFDPGNLMWIDVTTNRWTVSFRGCEYVVDWDDLGLPPVMLSAFRTVCMKRLRRQSPRFIGAVKNTLVAFKECLVPEWQDFGDITIDDLAEIWDSLSQSYRVYIRVLYRSMADLGIGGASQRIALELESWKARSEVTIIRHVMNWHQTKGALTSSEEKLLREALRAPDGGYETDKEHFARLYGWLLLETMKRPSQILDVSSAALKKVVEENGTERWFISIKPMKHQTGEPLKWWDIPAELVAELKEFSHRPKVRQLQSQFDRLLVFDAPCLYKHRVISVADANSVLRQIVKKKALISPRTNKAMHVTPLRIRHTIATRLAFNGVPRDVIQDYLEHDSPDSAQAYIDAIGTDIVPAIEKAGRRMGNVFHELNKTYFEGMVTEEVESLPQLVVPTPASSPMIVGSCKRPVDEGPCKRHPFLSCYDGCHCFQAWRDPGPHAKALTYFEQQADRWTALGRSTVANLAVETYSRAANAAREIIQSIGGN